MQGERVRHMGVLRITTALSFVLAASSAHAQEASSAAAQTSVAGSSDVAAAARAFQEGQKAQLSGDFARAAELFELADELAPTPEAVRSAIRNHDAARHPARAATLALAAAERYPEDTATSAMVDELLARVTPLLARLTIRCDQPCVLLIDGEALTVEAVARADAFVPPGSHAIEARFPTEQRETHTLELAAGDARELELRAPALPELEPAPPSPERAPAVETLAERQPLPPAAPRAATAASDEDDGLPPWLFLTAGALTVTGAAASLISGLDALDKRDAYEADPTRGGYERGVESESRTNALLIATAGLAATSAVLFAFTDWSGDDGAERASTTTLSLSPLAPNLVLRSTLP